MFSGQIAAWLWFTVLFANFAESVAEGRGKAQADALRRARSDTMAQRYVDHKALSEVLQSVNALDLRVGDVVLVKQGEIIPGDGEIIEGVASVNESAITGESAPVIREGRRRPLGRHRRHDGVVGLDQGAHLGAGRLDVPRPHDLAG